MYGKKLPPEMEQLLRKTTEKGPVGRTEDRNIISESVVHVERVGKDERGIHTYKIRKIKGPGLKEFFKPGEIVTETDLDELHQSGHRVREVKNKVEPITKVSEEVEQLAEWEREVPIAHRHKRDVSHYRVLHNGKDVSRHATYEEAVQYAKRYRGKMQRTGYSPKHVTVHAYVREEAEPLDELSKATLGRYIQRATSDRAMSVQNVRADAERLDTLAKHGHEAGFVDKVADRVGDDLKRIKKRSKGIDMAFKNLTKEEVEQIDEISKGRVRAVAAKAGKEIDGLRKKIDSTAHVYQYHADKASKYPAHHPEHAFHAGQAAAAAAEHGSLSDQLARRKRLVDKTNRHVTPTVGGGSTYLKMGEEVEPINEISGEKLGRYIVKARKDIEAREKKSIEDRDELRKQTGLNVGTPFDDNLLKRINRQNGISKALGKLQGFPMFKQFATEEADLYNHPDVYDHAVHLLSNPSTSSEQLHHIYNNADKLTGRTPPNDRDRLEILHRFIMKHKNTPESLKLDLINNRGDKLIGKNEYGIHRPYDVMDGASAAVFKAAVNHPNRHVRELALVHPECPTDLVKAQHHNLSPSLQRLRGAFEPRPVAEEAEPINEIDSTSDWAADIFARAKKKAKWNLLDGGKTQKRINRLAAVLGQDRTSTQMARRDHDPAYFYREETESSIDENYLDTIANIAASFPTKKQKEREKQHKADYEKWLATQRKPTDDEVYGEFEKRLGEEAKRRGRPPKQREGEDTEGAEVENFAFRLKKAFDQSHRTGKASVLFGDGGKHELTRGQIHKALSTYSSLRLPDHKEEYIEKISTSHGAFKQHHDKKFEPKPKKDSLALRKIGEAADLAMSYTRLPPNCVSRSYIPTGHSVHLWRLGQGKFKVTSGPNVEDQKELHTGDEASARNMYWKMVQGLSRDSGTSVRHQHAQTHEETEIPAGASPPNVQLTRSARKPKKNKYSKKIEEGYTSRGRREVATTDAAYGEYNRILRARKLHKKLHDGGASPDEISAKVKEVYMKNDDFKNYDEHKKRSDNFSKLI